MRRWPAAAMVRRQSQGAACGAGEVTGRRVQAPRGGGDRPAWSGARNCCSDRLLSFSVVVLASGEGGGRRCWAPSQAGAGHHRKQAPRWPTVVAEAGAKAAGDGVEVDLAGGWRIGRGSERRARRPPRPVAGVEAARDLGGRRGWPR